MPSQTIVNTTIVNGDPITTVIQADSPTIQSPVTPQFPNVDGSVTAPGPQGPVGPQGPAGTQILYGTGAPSDGVGADGDTFIDTVGYLIYYPKGTPTPGSWAGITPVSLVGPPGADGDDGDDGADGFSLLNGSSDPTTQGVDGDFFINTTSNNIFGPKSGGSWGSGTSIVGPAGATGAAGAAGSDGADGADGDDGADGNTLIYGTVAPTTEGVDGDSYINTTTHEVYYNKGSDTPGSWTNTGPFQLAPNPNGCRIRTNDSATDVNASGGNPIKWNVFTGSEFKDSGITHDTVTNNTKIYIAAGFSGRYSLTAYINYASSSAQRLTPRAFVKIDGVAKDGESFNSYSRSSGTPTVDRSTMIISWTGYIAAGSYIEVWTEQGQQAGTGYIFGSGSFVDIEQKSLLSLLPGVAAGNVSVDDSSLSYTAANAQEAFEAIDPLLSGYDPGSFSNATPNGSGWSGTTKSRKASTGTVYVTGDMTAGTAATLSTLVAGHRPASTISRVILNETTQTPIICYIYSTGNLTLVGGSFSAGNTIRISFQFET